MMKIEAFVNVRSTLSMLERECLGIIDNANRIIEDNKRLSKELEDCKREIENLKQSKNGK